MTETARQRWAVVGGGILGMTLALRLAQRGQTVTLIEKRPQLGGLASTWSLGDVVWDRHYHVTLMSDSYTRDILRELELEQEMEWVTTRTGFYTNGRLYPMSTSLQFLLFPPLGPISKARLGGTILHASKLSDWKSLEHIPVEDWLRKWSGNATFEQIWLPLLRAKLGDAYERTSAAFIWATIQRMYAARRSGLKQEMFGYMPGGYARILDTFRSRLEAEGVHIFQGADVCAVADEPTRDVRVELKGGTRIRFDRVVLTTPAPIASHLCPGLSQNEQDLLGGVEYQGIVCSSILLKKPLARYYITNITDSWVPFTGIIEMSALVDRKQFGGQSLIYLPKYVPSGDPAFEVPDHEWGELAMETLTRMYSGFDPADVVAFRVSRERFVYALPTLGYSTRIPPRYTSLPGVSIVNSAQILNGTLNVNETVRLAEEAIEGLLSDTTERPRWSQAREDEV